jgi:GTPase SAR1 family protein
MPDAQPAVSSSKQSRLKQAVKGRIHRPLRTLIYGTEGVGKSTFAAQAPSPFFVATESGTDHLDVIRDTPKDWPDVLDILHELLAEPHDYQTVVIDTLDRLEPMIWSALVARDLKGKPHKGIEDIGGGWGKGYIAALDYWRELQFCLERLRDERGMGSILVGHSTRKRYNNPEGEDYDQITIKINDKAAAQLREWCDVVLYATHETLTYETKTSKVKAMSTGRRVLHTVKRAAFDAKNRLNLPETIDLSYQAFADAVASSTPEQLKKRIASLFPKMSDDIRARVTPALTQAGDDPAKLSAILSKMETIAAAAAANTNNNAVDEGPAS